MRNHAIRKLTDIAEKDERIMLVCADLGYNVLNIFEEKFPERYVNVGIAEQNMTAVATGLALEGNIVFTYSIGNFPTLRCMEQIRNDVCYHNANVKILSVGGGFAYGDLGMSHHATEDIAMMRALPAMQVYVPADPIEAAACIEEVYEKEGPAFVRMAKGGEPFLHNSRAIENISDLQPMADAGSDINILACGSVVSEGIRLKEMLDAHGYSVGVYSVPCIKPAAEEIIKNLARSCRLLVTMEEHTIIGGLGGMVAEVISEIHGIHAALFRVGLRDTYTGVVGSQVFLRDCYGLSAKSCYQSILNRMEKLD